MKPTIQTERYALYHGNTLQVMAALPDQSVDAIITDPPYGTTACKWDSVIPFAPMWEQLKRIIKPRGAIVLFGSQPFTSALVMSNVKWFKYSWVYKKSMPTNFLNAWNRPKVGHEDISVFSDGVIANGSARKMRYNPQLDRSRGWKKISRSDPRGDSGVWARGNRQRFEIDCVRSNDFILPSTVLEFKNGHGGKARIHPTQKPVALMEYLVKTYTNEGDTVLDFTIGSGSTGVACMNTGRDFIGIDNGYCEKENSEYNGLPWVDVAHSRMSNKAGMYTPTPAEKASPQLSLFGATSA